MAKLEPTEEQDAEVFERFGGVCVLAQSNGSEDCTGRAEVIHEIEPRSQRPADWTDPANRVTLCHPCHWWVHNVMGTRAARPMLEQGAAAVIAERSAG